MFDGSSFTSFNTGNSPISSDFVRGIGIDADNVKWICTDNGLNRFDDTSWTVYNTSNSALPVNNIACIAFENDSLHTKWIGTVNGGFVMMNDTGTVVYSSFTTGYPDNTNLKIAIDSLDFKWVATPAACLVRFVNGNAVSFNSFNSQNPSNSIFDLAIDESQRIYMASYDSGLVRKDGLDYTTLNTTNSAMPENILNAVAIEETGIIWAGTYTQGLVRIDEGILFTPASKKEIDMTIYPQPAADFFFLNIGKNISNEYFTITDLAGKVVLRKEMNGGKIVRCNTSDFSSGLYLISYSGRKKLCVVQH